MRPLLTLKDTLELSFLSGDQINTHWKLYYTVVFALLAWLSSNISVIGILEASLVTVWMIIFSVFNAVGLIRLYKITDLFVDEANELAKKDHFSSKMLESYTKQDARKYSFSFRSPLVIVAHILAAVAIIYISWEHVI